MAGTAAPGHHTIGLRASGVGETGVEKLMRSFALSGQVPLDVEIPCTATGHPRATSRGRRVAAVPQGPLTTTLRCTLGNPAGRAVTAPHLMRRRSTCTAMPDAVSSTATWPVP